MMQAHPMVEDLPSDPAAVRATYEAIATDFARTRQQPWPAVTSFLEGREAVVGLDLGCGNGRHLPILAENARWSVGLDLSRSLLRIASRDIRPTDTLLVEGSADHLPLRANTIGLAIFVATLHHLPSKDRRVDSLNELARVLAPDAPALIGVWSVTHDRFEYETATETTVEWTLPNGRTVPRYYQLYDRPTFEAELAASDLSIRRSWLEAGNHYAVVEPAVKQQSP